MSYLIFTLKYSERNLFEQFFSEFLFSNIVTVSLQLKETGFAEEFIQNYKNLLNPGIREDTVNYCNANIKYNKKDYGDALKIAGKIKIQVLSE